MAFLLFCILFILFICFIWWIALWFNHVTSIKNKTYDWATYQDFLTIIKKEINKYENTRIRSVGYYIKYVIYEYKRTTMGTYESWTEFIRCEKTEICINNNYMLLDPISYLLYLKWHKEHANGNKRVKGLWKDVNQWDY